MVRKKNFCQMLAFVLPAAVLIAAAGSARASTLVPQTALPGDCVPQFQVQMPVFGPAGPIPRVNATQYPKLEVTMKEVNQVVLPQGVYNCGGNNYNIGPTRVWGYEIKDALTGKLLGPANWPAVTVEARRYIPSTFTYVNALPAFDPANSAGAPYTAGGLVQGLVTVDKTIDWADPLTTNCGIDSTGPGCFSAFTGSPPAVVHLHGAEVSSRFDGGPLAWFTPDGATGSQYNSLVPAGPGKAVYLYQNQ